jgi:hypothetical protein
LSLHGLRQRNVVFPQETDGKVNQIEVHVVQLQASQ